MQYEPDDMTWTNDELAAFKYIPWRSPEHNHITSLILDFKKNDPRAVTHVYNGMLMAMWQFEARLRDTYRCRYIVCAPSHSTGVAANLRASEQVAEGLADEFSWLTYLPGALERIESVQKAANQPTREQRPGVGDHLRTIRYVGAPMNIPHVSIILLDDVRTTGDTANACRHILQRATRCRTVIGLFAARTVYV